MLGLTILVRSYKILYSIELDSTRI